MSVMRVWFVFVNIVGSGAYYLYDCNIRILCIEDTDIHILGKLNTV